MLVAAANEGLWGGVATWPTDMALNSGCDWVFLFGTFLRHLKLFRMTIQQDPNEPDRWWFAPLLYAGTAVLIAAFVWPELLLGLPTEDAMNTTTLLIIIVVLLLLCGGWYGRGRWY